MKVTLVPKIEIENCHPKGMRSATDMEYSKIATEILKRISRLDVADIPASGLKLIALNVALYFEDVISDVGIWRSFTDKIKEVYGRRLPFFDIDVENYFQDEPNLEDVKLLVWYIMLEVHHGKIGNPENPVLERIANEAFAVLEEHFETAPVNETLKDFFKNPQFVGDFYKMRDTMKWLIFGCYLTYVPQALNIVMAQAQEFMDMTHCTPDMAIYDVECNMPYRYKIGPLMLLPQEWLAMILRANGNDEAADKIGNQKCKPSGIYKLTGVDKKNNFSFEDVEGESFTVSEEELNFPPGECRNRKAVVASFVDYDGEWHLNGGSSWTDDLDAFDKMNEDYKGKLGLHDTYDRLVKDAGSRLYYFADTAALKDFLLKNLPFEEEVAKNFSLPEGQENLSVFIPEDYGDFEIFPDGALCIKDKRNPFYNEKWSRNQAMNFALSVSPEMRSYLIENKLLPDATINSSKGIERGNEIVQQNFDFITKAVVSRL